MDSAGARARFERSLAGEIVQELVRIEAVDRALALASKLFVAVIPLSILLRSVAPGSGDFGDDLVERLGLSGLGASATRTLFAKGTEVRGAVSVIGILIVLYSVLSFTRALQRMYLNVWRLRPQLPDALVRELTWIVGFIAYTVILAPLRNFEHSHDVPSLYGPSAIALGAVFWLWTPYILLGKRIPWHRLIPTGFVTTVGVTAYSIGTAIFLPDIFTTNAERYGLIGIAFGMVTWLFAYAAVVIVSAVLGWTWDEHREAARRRAAGEQSGEGAGQADEPSETIEDAEQQGA
jgi:membrane protein